MEWIIEKTKHGNKLTIKIDYKTHVMITDTEKDYIVSKVVDREIVDTQVLPKPPTNAGE